MRCQSKDARQNGIYLLSITITLVLVSQKLLLQNPSCRNKKYGMVWYGMVWYGMVWYGMVWYGMVWYGTVWYGMVWYGMVWYGMVWYGMSALERKNLRLGCCLQLSL